MPGSNGNGLTDVDHVGTILDVFERCCATQSGKIGPKQLGSVLKTLEPEWKDEQIERLITSLGPIDDGVPCKEILSWLFQEPFIVSRRPIKGVGELLEALYSKDISAEDAFVKVNYMAQLQELIRQHPYLEPGCSVQPHPLQHWAQRCRESYDAKKFRNAQDELQRLVSGLYMDLKQLAEAFRRFDIDQSGHLDPTECRHMCAYLGWSLEEAELMDLDRDGRITQSDFQAFVGRMGGMHQLFEQRRLRIGISRRDVCDHAGLTIGARVRAHFYVHRQKSRSWREAQVIAVGVEMKAGATDFGPATYGVLLEFGFGENSDKKRRWRSRQIVPTYFVLSSVEDADVATALRQVGILDEQQAFWTLLLPDSELQEMSRLEDCQRQALATVRAHATVSHDNALEKCRERFQKLGYSEQELQAVLSWVQDLAPVCVHVHLDRMGHFMETDEFYRNQFETKTSCGALDGENRTRKNWEHELFGGAYDDAKGFDRCKYGALNVMNDYRGVVKAKGYGDSYLVLKDVRLRCTFAATDSGGIKGSRLGVLDKYAHVLQEYNDTELRGLVAVAMAAMNPDSDFFLAQPKLLRGSTEDPNMEWVTIGFPTLKQQSGRFYFEVTLEKGCATPQVGLLSPQFERLPRAKSTQGVGDDVHGWAVDGQNAACWHGGRSKAWNRCWPSESVNSTRVLKNAVVVGVAVDFESRTIRFSADGDWDEPPVFDENDLPRGVELYPAVSTKGKSCFNFGPTFAHSPPSDDFTHWLGAPQGSMCTWNPRIGNEETLSIYKEVQVHGEVCLKRHVQRLVACQKYRENPKEKRSWAVCVKKSIAPFKGTYQRVGARNGMPFYKCETGAVIWCDPAAGCWKLGQSEDSEKFKFFSEMNGTFADMPPRRGWKVPEDVQGGLPIEALTGVLTDFGIDSEAIEAMTKQLRCKDSAGRDVIQMERNGTSFEAEWEKLGFDRETAEQIWIGALNSAQKKLQDEAGFSMGTVVETRHPYDSKRHKWNRGVELENAAGLVVYFHSKSCTLDKKARFQIFSGGLRREGAGVGARVEVPVPGGDKIWGTVVERKSEKEWAVQLDRSACLKSAGEPASASDSWPAVGDLVEAKYKTGVWHKATIEEVREDGTYLLAWYDGLTKDREKPKEKIREAVAKEADHRNLEDLTRYANVASGIPCFATCLDEPRCCKVTYEADATIADDQGRTAVVGDEIETFALNEACPLTPITVGSFAGPGPAQEQGVQVGWFLDLVATVCGTSSDAFVDLLRGIGGDDLGAAAPAAPADGRASPDGSDPSYLLDAAFANVHELLRRLNGGLRELAGVTLVFTDSSSPSQVQLLPEARARYEGGQTVGDEIETLQGSEKKQKMYVKAFRKTEKRGPAQVAGVRTDWVVDLEKTRLQNPGKLDDESVLADGGAVLLKMTDITVVFKSLDPQSQQRFQGSGGGPWKKCEVRGDSVHVEFSTDGDGGDRPDQRWGVWAIVLPQAARKNQEEVDKFAAAWVELAEGALGNRVKDLPEIEKDGWDESRLRALCARHGWDFEWMTEDGERRRRGKERWSSLRIAAAAVRPLKADVATPDDTHWYPEQHEATAE